MIKTMRTISLSVIFSALFVAGSATTAHAQVDDESPILPVISTISTNFISVTSPTPYTTTVAIFGTDLGYVLDSDVSIQLGPLTATSVGGNSTGMNVTFNVDAETITEARASYPIIILNAGDIVVTSGDLVELYNPYQLTATPQQTKRYLNKTPRKKKTHKRTVGLNVHWALGGSSTDDDSYAQKVDQSGTIWVREHISYESIMGENQSGWLKRYDQTMLRYDDRGIRVVAMLAYGEEDNEFAPPATEDWATFVDLVTQRYGNYVDAWEIWNEPDSPDYLTPNTWKAYEPLLRTGSEIIRTNDPDSIVLNGAIADITKPKFLRLLYNKGSQYFDELNVHVYYCDEYRDDGESLGRLALDWEAFLKRVKSYRKKEKIWITELGCSTGLSGVDNKMVRRYNKKAVTQLLQTPRMRPIFLYTIRDRDYLAPYEANFGLLEQDFVNKPAWNWYRKLKRL